MWGKVAIANQPHGLVEQGYSASLPEENQVSGVEVKADHEGESSSAPVTSAEKWSHEAIDCSTVKSATAYRLNKCFFL
ncbi:hypothetical protein [Nostoc sp. CALU 546]|uniref:hypothetical protein n=1 Tax=Nostoc sp. CALU 546 TaxID=1867241 RepID=UPI003B67379E